MPQCKQPEKTWQSALAAQDPAALDLVQKAAAAGDAEALCVLADRLFRGDGVRRNEQKAREALEQAAKLGSAEALFRIGLAHDFGDMDYPADRETMLQYLLAAARLGHVRAQIAFADHCAGHGDWTEEDACFWLEQASRAGSCEARTLLAEALWKSGKRDEAIAWLEQAATQETCPEDEELYFETAPATLAFFLMERDAPGDRARAVEQLERVADTIPDAARTLAFELFLGIAVPRDPERAMELLLQAAELKDEVAAPLIRCSDYTTGLKKLRAAARSKQAGMDQAEARFCLALNLMYGIGIARDPEQALELMRMALQQRSPQAWSTVRLCPEFGSLQQDR